MERKKRVEVFRLGNVSCTGEGEGEGVDRGVGAGADAGADADANAGVSVRDLDDFCTLLRFAELGR